MKEKPLKPKRTPKDLAKQAARDQAEKRVNKTFSLLVWFKVIILVVFIFYVWWKFFR